MSLSFSDIGTVPVRQKKYTITQIESGFGTSDEIVKVILDKIYDLPSDEGKSDSECDNLARQNKTGPALRGRRKQSPEVLTSTAVLQRGKKKSQPRKNKRFLLDLNSERKCKTNEKLFV